MTTSAFIYFIHLKMALRVAPVAWSVAAAAAIVSVSLDNGSVEAKAIS